MTTIDNIKLNNGVQMPPIGLGVFQSPPDVTAEAVELALRVGYRHIDTAAAYQNEKQVGEGIRNSGVDRKEIFIETKVWVSDYGYDETLHAYDKAINKLGVDYLDLLILHQPNPDNFDKTIQAYKALERLLADGKVRAIGVSNFLPSQLEELIANTDIVPAVNQVELHPYFSQPDVQAANTKHGVLTQAWSPIGGITFYGAYGDKHKSVMDDAMIQEIAKMHDKTPAQVMIRWHLQEGRSAMPKSTNPGRIAENFNVFDFELTDEEIAKISSLDTGVRGGPNPLEPQPGFHSFRIPEE